MDIHFHPEKAMDQNTSVISDVRKLRYEEDMASFFFFFFFLNFTTTHILTASKSIKSEGSSNS